MQDSKNANKQIQTKIYSQIEISPAGNYILTSVDNINIQQHTFKTIDSEEDVPIVKYSDEKFKLFKLSKCGRAFLILYKTQIVYGELDSNGLRDIDVIKLVKIANKAGFVYETLTGVNDVPYIYTFNADNTISIYSLYTKAHYEAGIDSAILLSYSTYCVHIVLETSFVSYKPNLSKQFDKGVNNHYGLSNLFTSKQRLIYAFPFVEEFILVCESSASPSSLQGKIRLLFCLQNQQTKPHLLGKFDYSNNNSGDIEYTQAPTANSFNFRHISIEQHNLLLLISDLPCAIFVLERDQYEQTKKIKILQKIYFKKLIKSCCYFLKQNILTICVAHNGSVVFHDLTLKNPYINKQKEFIPISKLLKIPSPLEIFEQKLKSSRSRPNIQLQKDLPEIIQQSQQQQALPQIKISRQVTFGARQQPIQNNKDDKILQAENKLNNLQKLIFSSDDKKANESRHSSQINENTFQKTNVVTNQQNINNPFARALNNKNPFLPQQNQEKPFPTNIFQTKEKQKTTNNPFANKMVPKGKAYFSQPDTTVSSPYNIFANTQPQNKPVSILDSIIPSPSNNTQSFQRNLSIMTQSKILQPQQQPYQSPKFGSKAIDFQNQQQIIDKTPRTRIQAMFQNTQQRFTFQKAQNKQNIIFKVQNNNFKQIQSDGQLIQQSLETQKQQQQSIIIDNIWDSNHNIWDSNHTNKSVNKQFIKYNFKKYLNNNLNQKQINLNTKSDQNPTNLQQTLQHFQTSLKIIKRTTKQKSKQLKEIDHYNFNLMKQVCKLQTELSLIFWVNNINQKTIKSIEQIQKYVNILEAKSKQILFCLEPSVSILGVNQQKKEQDTLDKINQRVTRYIQKLLIRIHKIRVNMMSNSNSKVNRSQQQQRSVSSTVKSEIGKGKMYYVHQVKNTGFKI